MANNHNSKNLDSIFEALVSKHRREIIYLLGLQPHSISQLASIRRLSLPAIHKHINILLNAKLITRKKVGRTSFLAIKRDSLNIIQNWIAQFHPYWGNNKETLVNYKKWLKGGENK